MRVIFDTVRHLPQILSSWIMPNLRLFRTSRLPIVWLLALGIGSLVAAAAIAFRSAIGLLQWPWLGTTSERIIDAAASQPWWVILLTPALGGLIVGWLLQSYQPKQRAGGVADVIEARALGGRGLPLRAGLTSALITVISLGFGASAGREGPVVHLGATLGTAVCRAFSLPDSARRMLLACGVASAVSASFNAPIAGVLFAHEVVLGHYAVSAFVPIVLASAVGAVLSRLWFGESASFIIPTYDITSYLEIPAFALLGLTCAAVAILFQFALIGSDWTARNISMPLWLRPVVGGLAVGAIAIVFPQVLGVGYEATDMALKHQLPITVMLALLVAKTAATAITLASRFGGGIFSPSLYLGAMTGGAFGLIAASAFPEMASSHGLYAILGMGGVAAAVLGAPVSTTMIVFELTGGYGLSIALLIVVSISAGLTQAIHGKSYFHWQLGMRGVCLHEGSHTYLSESVKVRDFMDAPPEDEEERTFNPGTDGTYLHAGNSLENALKAFDESGKISLPVVESGDATRVVGIARHVRALRYFNSALIKESEEAHR
ncbi:chloride channel protein [Labrenzia sp. CE80]|uniref:chloride channel protein n=1 Tax=Labrenzia sp. CE80 TaxID=1788986 RepID=UPI00129ACCB5|nr:chloride channel protein [Labrenzia sp. CE80]